MNVKRLPFQASGMSIMSAVVATLILSLLGLAGARMLTSQLKASKHVQQQGGWTLTKNHLHTFFKNPTVCKDSLSTLPLDGKSHPISIRLGNRVLLSTNTQALNETKISALNAKATATSSGTYLVEIQLQADRVGRGLTKHDTFDYTDVVNATDSNSDGSIDTCGISQNNNTSPPPAQNDSFHRICVTIWGRNLTLQHRRVCSHGHYGYYHIVSYDKYDYCIGMQTGSSTGNQICGIGVESGNRMRLVNLNLGECVFLCKPK